MALPKRRHSSARRDKRRANWKIVLPTLVPCPSCQKLRLPHNACPACGYYAGETVMDVKKQKAKA